MKKDERTKRNSAKRINILAAIESPQALMRLSEIVEADSRLAALVVRLLCLSSALD